MEKEVEAVKASNHVVVVDDIGEKGGPALILDKRQKCVSLFVRSFGQTLYRPTD